MLNNQIRDIFIRLDYCMMILALTAWLWLWPRAIASNYYCVTGSAARKKYAVLFCRKSQFWSRLFGMSRTESGRSGKYKFFNALTYVYILRCIFICLAIMNHLNMVLLTSAYRVCIGYERVSSFILTSQHSMTDTCLWSILTFIYHYDISSIKLAIIIWVVSSLL